MGDSHRLVEGFFPKAAALRAAFDDRLAGGAPAQRQVWEVARGRAGGAFLRANALRVLPQGLVAELVTAVQSWAALTLGLARASVPELRLLVGGSREAPAPGDADGLWSWDLALPPAGGGAPGGAIELATPAGAVAFAPSFNRFAAWDDRLAAGTRPVDGPLDPATAPLSLRGRLHGDGVALAGPLPLDSARVVLLRGAERIAVGWGGRWRGHLGLRLRVTSDGIVADATALYDGLAAAGPGGTTGTAAAVAEALDELRALRFPHAGDTTSVHFSIVAGTPAA